MNHAAVVGAREELEVVMRVRTEASNAVRVAGVFERELVALFRRVDSELFDCFVGACCEQDVALFQRHYAPYCVRMLF